MANQERKTVLDVPLKVALTEAGMSVFLRQNKKLARFKLADQSEETGLELEKFVPASLQRMILADYLSKIEISQAEFVSCRQEVMDLCKLVVYGLLYRQYNTHLFNRILASDLIRRWNRANPQSVIDEKTRFNDAFLQNFVKDRASAILEIKAELLAPLRSSITKNGNLLADEKNIQLFLSERFLNNLKPSIWFILSKFRSLDGFDTLAREIRMHLAEYMDKARIAEHVALMVIELAVNAENANLRRKANAMYRGTLDPAKALLDESVRRKVIDELKKKNELVFLNWKIGGTSSSIGTQGKLQITIYNMDGEYKEIKDSIDSKKTADLKNKTLFDLYKELPKGGPDTELGLYYLSYLSEACDKVSVKFESMVANIKESNTTVINLSFNL